jgi:fucose 4-O-acetylase-like acetyltransferase
VTGTQNRDLGLDILKGVGCALMVIAHSKLKMWNYEDAVFWGNLAPALFFSTAGVTAVLQAGKPPRGMLFFYGFIFLLGFSYSGFLDADFLNNFQFEIIQTIAAGVLTVYLIEHFLHPDPWIYAALGVFAFGLDKLIYPLGFEFLEGILIAPGLFPLIPWLSIFFFGVFAYRIRHLYNLVLFLGCVALYYLLFGFILPDVHESKWQFLPEFFIASSAALFLAFFLARSIPAGANLKAGAPILFLGRNSLLFLYIHYAVIKFLRLYKVQQNVEVIFNHPWLFWVLALAFSTVAMWVILSFAKWFEFPFRRIFIWIVLLALIFAAPFAFSKPSYASYFELLPGIAFAIYYPLLGRILKESTP